MVRWTTAGGYEPRSPPKRVGDGVDSPPVPTSNCSMSVHSDQPAVSVIVPWSLESRSCRSAMDECITSILGQDFDSIELIVVNGSDAQTDQPAEGSAHAAERRVHRISGAFASRAAAFNAALADARGDWVLLLRTDVARVRLKRSAVTAFVTVAGRHSEAGMVYADYERVEADGKRHEIHLSAFHRGRLRETTDFGPAVLYRAQALRAVGGFDERYTVAEHYDLRLRISERYQLIHISSRRDGSLYSVAGSTSGRDVFDYLLDDRVTRQEMEQALTEHLRRTGAYLASGVNIDAVPQPVNAQYELVASVIIPVNQRPEFIGTAIESVQTQTLPEVEAIVVVNGGPDDPTIPAVRRYLPDGDLYDVDKPPIRLHVLDINNIGLCLNVGLAAAGGRYYVQLDSDDRLKPEAVERLIAVFESDPTIGMVIGSYEVWDRDDATGQVTRNPDVPVVTHDEWTPDNGRNNLLRVNGAGAPRAAPIEVIRQVGGFGCNDTPYSRNYGEDYDLVLRISERYNIGRVWEPIYEVVRHAGGTDHSIDEATAARNDDAKDDMRREALHRRQAINWDLGLTAKQCGTGL